MINNYRVWCENKKEWEKDKIAMLQNGSLIQLRNMQPLRKETHIVEFRTTIKDMTLFVGDIIEIEFLRKKVRCVVVVKNSSFWLENIKNHESFITFGLLHMKDRKFKLLGNIHENKELLEG